MIDNKFLNVTVTMYFAVHLDDGTEYVEEKLELSKIPNLFQLTQKEHDYLCCEIAKQYDTDVANVELITKEEYLKESKYELDYKANFEGVWCDDL